MLLFFKVSFTLALMCSKSSEAKEFIEMLHPSKVVVSRGVNILSDCCHVPFKKNFQKIKTETIVGSFLVHKDLAKKISQKE